MRFGKGDLSGRFRAFPGFTSLSMLITALTKSLWLSFTISKRVMVWFLSLYLTSSPTIKFGLSRLILFYLLDPYCNFQLKDNPPFFWLWHYYNLKNYKIFINGKNAPWGGKNRRNRSKKIVRHHRLTIFHLVSYIIIFSLERISPHGRSPSDHDTFLLRVSHFVILFHVLLSCFSLQMNILLLLM